MIAPQVWNSMFPNQLEHPDFVYKTSFSEEKKRKKIVHDNSQTALD